MKKSAEVIVVADTSCAFYRNNTEVSQNNEGLNVKWFQFNKEVQIKLASLILKEAGCNWCKERLHLYLTNRCIRDPYVQWCERRTSSLTSGEAVYSICFNKTQALKLLNFLLCIIAFLTSSTQEIQ